MIARLDALPSELHTPRLILRPISLCEAEPIIGYSTFCLASEIRSGTAWEKGWDTEGFLQEEARKTLSRMEPSPFGIYLRDRSNELTGVVGVAPVSLSAGEMELLFCIPPEFTGEGIATEAARSVVEFALNQLGAKTIRGRCLLEDPGTATVLGKLRMKFLFRMRIYPLLSGPFWDVGYYNLREAKTVPANAMCLGPRRYG